MRKLPIKRINVFLILLTVILFFTEKKTAAQEIFSPPPAEKLTEFPFRLLSGGIILVKAQLDDYQDSLNFVLDTGSGGISLDSTTAVYLGVKTEPSSRTVRGIAGMKTVQFAYGHNLKLPGLVVEKLDFHINDYDILTSAYGIHIDGIMGFSFLRHYVVSINYDDSTIRVYSPGTFKYPRGGYMLKPKFTNIPIEKASLRDNNAFTSSFYFDTGAGLCLLLNEETVADSSLLKKKRKRFKTEAQGLGGRKEMSITVIREVKIGNYKFKSVPVYIFDDEFDVTSYPVLGGLIGNDLLRRFNIVVNYPNHEIFIKPNSHFKDVFDYSYTGLGMYLIDGAITITDIMEKSPAETAGFQVGDVVLGVGNNFTGNIQAYKTLLQNANSKIDILINREGEVKLVRLKIKSIL